MDFFALEPQLLVRLPQIVQFKGKPIDVYPVDDVKLDGEDEPVPLRVPCLLVMFDGYGVPESDESKARTQQNWTVIVCVANVRGSGRTEARAESQALVDQLLVGLIGWKPDTVDQRPFKALKLAAPSIGVSYGKRNSYFPFSFTTERVVRGARS